MKAEEKAKRLQEIDRTIALGEATIEKACKRLGISKDDLKIRAKQKHLH